MDPRSWLQRKCGGTCVYLGARVSLCVGFTPLHQLLTSLPYILFLQAFSHHFHFVISLFHPHSVSHRRFFAQLWATNENVKQEPVKDRSSWQCIRQLSLGWCCPIKKSSGFACSVIYELYETTSSLHFSVLLRQTHERCWLFCLDPKDNSTSVVLPPNLQS